MNVNVGAGKETSPLVVFDESIRKVIPKRSASVCALGGGASFFWVARYFQQSRTSVVVLTETWHELNVWRENLAAILGKEKVLGFPGWDTSPFDVLSPDKEIVAERMRTLIRIADNEPCVVVTSVKSAVQKFIPKESLLSRNFHLKRGETYERKNLFARLTEMGYVRVDQVETQGEYSVRGEVIDLFSPFHDHPVRIDFFDDEAESLRFFSIEDQLSLEEIEVCQVIPAQEVMLDKQTTQNCLGNLLALKNRSLPQAYREIYQSVENGIPFVGMERCLPFYYNSLESLFDYFSIPPKFIVWDRETLEKYAFEYAEEIKSDIVISLEQGYVTPEPKKFFLGFRELLEHSGHGGVIELNASLGEGPDAINLNFVGNENLHLSALEPNHPSKTHLSKILDAIQSLDRNQCSQVICVRSHSSAQRVGNLMKEIEIDTRILEISEKPEENIEELFKEASHGCVPIALLKIHKGFRFTVEGQTIFSLLSEDDIFGEKEKRKVFRRASPKQITQSLSQLSIGDYVVHVEYGIAIYKGLQTISVNNENQEFVLLHFKNDDKIFVPVDAIDLIQKYSGGDGPSPLLSKLGDSKWSKTKAKVREDVRKIATELVKLYAQRKMKRGIAFSRDNEMFREFCYGFQFQETEDQEKTIDEVLRDMESEKVVDRLVCGDVGFGKTEVAMRAACKASLDGYQVGVLCPTTILAQQHYLTFRKRFENFPVTVDSVSRMKDPAEIKKTLQKAKEGRVDILIGTHRILSKDVEFKNLGLLVVDEEQRFGVAHKEKLRHIKSDVDTITMSATPIPRTLNMSMIGIRDISVINTPPLNRRVVRTKIMKFNEFAIKEAVERELRRGGQIYFLHNAVESIHEVGNFLNTILPHVKIRIGHAQMGKNELEKVMIDFINNQFTILLCTTIIESGLDIPNANTIIINNAQKFGLSQLYQLRGRVGRSNKQAYALLLTPKHEILTTKAKKRLGVLQELHELASGFKIAAHDMELRGIGNLLGNQQSGHIESVGLELYMDMIGEEVARLKGQGAQSTAEKSQINIRLPVETLFPESFIPGSNLRLQCYKELNACSSEEQIWSLKTNFEDRFGKLPGEAENLFQTMHLKMKARKIHAEEIQAGQKDFLIKFSPDFSPDIGELMDFLKNGNGFMGKDNSLRFQYNGFSFETIQKTIDRLQTLENSSSPET